jgi:hypothetical protein
VTWTPQIGERVILSPGDGRNCWWSGMTGEITRFSPAKPPETPRQKPQISLWEVTLDPGQVGLRTGYRRLMEAGDIQPLPALCEEGGAP